jgi:predicted enzyme related to lactoylglutathione lyase
MNTIINWFEIPTTNLDRAVKFYESMLSTRLRLETFDGTPQALLLGDKNDAGGSLILDPRRKPSADGPLIYLDAKRDLEGCLERATRAGGRIVLPKTDIGDPGFIAIVADSEGNHVALHMEK